MRDQWNVTINQSRDVWIVLNQPPNPAGNTLITGGYFEMVTRTTAGAARIGRTRLTQDGGATWATLTADVFYDLILEAFGGAGETVEKSSELPEAFDRAMDSGVPYLLNVLTDPANAYPRSSNLA